MTDFPIYLVSMEGDNPRTPVAIAKIQDFFHREPCLIEGVDARTENFRERCMPVRPSCKELLLPGYVGCSTAHAMALLRFLETNEPLALILEDDPLFIGTLEEVESVRRFLLGTDFDWCKLTNTVLDGGPVYARGPESPHPFVRHVSQCSWSNAGYFVSRKGAAYLLTQMIPQYTTLDCITRMKAAERICYNVTRPLVSTDEKTSLILPPPIELKPPAFSPMYALTRTEIINGLIAKHGYTHYLEIGIGDGKNFENIEIATKHGVDPNRDTTFRLTSDDFFIQNPTLTYDIVFIDGLHIYEQVFDDIINALYRLREGGIIIVHDCNPDSEETQQRVRTTQRWHGDVWRAIVELRAKRDDLAVVTVDTDEGCGIVRPGRQELVSLPDLPAKVSYEYFDSHRKELLGLISTDEFIQRFL